jgi:hypothetical protein
MRKPALIALPLLVLAVFFGVETWQAWVAPFPAAGPGTGAGSGEWQPGLTATEQAPRDFTGIAAVVIARPLFRPDRQPYREPVGPVLPARNYDSELSQFLLLGVISLEGEPTGLVTSRVANRPERWDVKAGDTLPGFSVKEVRLDGLVLAADGREFLMPLYAGPPAVSKTGPVRVDTPRKDGTPAQPAPPAPQIPGAAPPPRPATQAVPPVPPSPAVVPRYIPRR